jgi:hypothetical protein
MQAPAHTRLHIMVLSPRAVALHEHVMSSMARNEISFGERNLGLQVGQSFAPINAEIHLPPGKLEQANLARAND